MAAEGQNSSPYALDDVGDITNVGSRTDGYESLIPPGSNLVDKTLIMSDAIGAGLKLGRGLLNKALPDKKIEELVNAVKGHAEACAELVDSPEGKNKFKFSVATTEAALKGFDLPLARDGDFNELPYKEVPIQEALDIPVNAVKKALVEVSGQNISKDRYAKAVIDKTMEILKKTTPEFSADKLQKYEKFITQGDKSQKFDPDKQEFNSRKNELPSADFVEAASKTADKFIKKFNENKKTAEVVKNFAPLLKSENKAIATSVKNALEKLSPEYLAQNNKEISEKLQKAANAKPPLVKRIAARFGFKASSRDYAAENVDKLVSIFEQQSKSYTNPNRFSVSPKQQMEKTPSLAAQKLVAYMKEGATGKANSAPPVTPKANHAQGKKEDHSR
ncbi:MULTISPECIES: hypothetical protein [unclassified Rickettsia]|uniref:hypothetical protein n=1 Tax=unclassified Rickettsia TaxID=114295 RepID=UPI003132DF7B